MMSCVAILFTRLSTPFRIPTTQPFAPSLSISTAWWKIPTLTGWTRTTCRLFSGQLWWEQIRALPLLMPAGRSRSSIPSCKTRRKYLTRTNHHLGSLLEHVIRSVKVEIYGGSKSHHNRKFYILLSISLSRHLFERYMPAEISSFSPSTLARC